MVWTLIPVINMSLLADYLIILVQYELHMFGIPIDGPDHLFFYDESVYNNYTFDESQ